MLLQNEGIAGAGYSSIRLELDEGGNAAVFHHSDSTRTVVLRHDTIRLLIAYLCENVLAAPVPERAKVAVTPTAPDPMKYGVCPECGKDKESVV